MRRFAAPLIALVALAPAVPQALAGHASPGGPPCTDAANDTFAIELPVGGGTATGYYALPSTPPKGIVVFSHGWTHGSASWREHMRRTTQDLGVISVAMDGRGLQQSGPDKAPGIPNYTGWPVMAAAEDGIAAGQHFEALCPSANTIVNYGVSMGANTSGIMAAAAATRSNGQPLFDWWIAVEGVHNLVETYHEAVAAGSPAAAHIEAETGGPFHQRQEAFRQRTNVALVNEIKAADLRGAVLIHGVDDGTVPYNQSQEMFGALTAVGIPTHFFTVVSKDAATSRDSSGTGHVAGRIDPNYRSELAGHGSEMSETHIVIMSGFDRLGALFGGGKPTCTRAWVVDGRLGTYPGVTGCP